MQLGIIGSGSWATAIAKILTDNDNKIFWWFRNAEHILQVKKHGFNPNYLSKTVFDTNKLILKNDVQELVDCCDIIVVAVPSAYVAETFSKIKENSLQGKKIISAVKGILPDTTELLQDFLVRTFHFDVENYFTLLGPCHAEEVASEKLSYLTFSGCSIGATQQMAQYFQNDYINTCVNTDVLGVQYAAVLKNIYALGAGIATGLGYGDNFLSVFIANAAKEMAHFLNTLTQKQAKAEYAVSVYWGDLLVTCYSLYSRNRMFGRMIGKGYTVKAAKLELNMEAEGYNASKCIYEVNEKIKADIPIAIAIYSILWQKETATNIFKKIEKVLI